MFTGDDVPDNARGDSEFLGQLMHPVEAGLHDTKSYSLLDESGTTVREGNLPAIPFLPNVGLGIGV